MAIAGNLPPIARGNGQGRDGDDGTQATKSKGKLPKDSWSFDTDMLPHHTKFLTAEIKHREEGTEQTQKSWYNGAIKEILRVSKQAPAADTNIDETTNERQIQDGDDDHQDDY